MLQKRFKFYAVVLFALCLLSSTNEAKAASLLLRPSSGAFSIGSTFDVQILLDTEEKIINAVNVELIFPPDKLQVVSPSLGQSIIGLWTALPKFDNAKGTITLQGGVPEGIRVSRGLLSTVTFRARGTGQAALLFDSDSQVFLNDGKGTKVLREAQGAVYSLVLPPPAGPLVVSETHPDQEKWYPNSDLILSWTNAVSVTGFSYALNQLPLFTPDDTIDSKQNSVSYKSLASGIHYFHIKAMNQDGVWGGVTHFAVKIDLDPPADFSIDLTPGSRTTNREVLFSWQTTDMHSGLNRYEYKVIPLTQAAPLEQTAFFFVEAGSPQFISLEKGTYDFIVRAYDTAGNFREVSARVRVLSPFVFWATNIYILTALALLLLILSFLAFKVWLRHREIHQRMSAKELPGSIREKLEELTKYKRKYGQLALLMALSLGSLFSAASLVNAQTAQFGPPFISTFPRQISNNEIFYLGGRTEIAQTEVIIYMQNLNTGETFSYSEMSGKNGEWFYRHPSLLSQGEYIVWTQSKVGAITSPPSPQLRLRVNPTAIQFGSSRISYETLYAAFAVLLLLALAGLTLFTFVWSKKARRLRRQLIKEIYEAEEAVRRGFDELRRDIEVELAVIKRAKLSKSLSREEKAKEEHLLKDLAEIERHISKEVADIEKTL